MWKIALPPPKIDASGPVGRCELAIRRTQLLDSETDVDGDAESSGEQGTAAGADDAAARRHDNNRGCQATSIMSRISGVRRARTASSSSVSKLDTEPPTYGVEGVPDSILSEVPTDRPLASLLAAGRHEPEFGPNARTCACMDRAIIGGGHLQKELLRFGVQMVAFRRDGRTQPSSGVWLKFHGSSFLVASS